MQSYERHNHYEHVDVSAVDIAPEYREGDNEPYVQYVSVCCEDKDK